MKIKSLLIGSAAASMLAVSGAQAADPIIYAEPEPLEYVRVCDVYGAGFFYIPGTETCLRIAGYVRYQMDYNARSNQIQPTIPANAVQNHTFGKLARFAPYFDVRTENAYGTLRGFAELEMDWTSGALGTGANPFVGTGTQNPKLHQAYIEQTVAGGTFRIGKSDTPYARFLGYGAGNVYGSAYGYNNGGEVSFTYTNAGLSFIAAAVESAGTEFEPNVELGANYAQSWGMVGGIFGYDNLNDNWGAKGVVRVSLAPVSLGLHVFYSSDDVVGTYSILNPAGGVSEWSALVHANVQATETIAVKGHFQWFDSTVAAPSNWQAVAGLDWRPVQGLEIQPEVLYTSRTAIVAPTGTTAGSDGGSNWTAALRFNRRF